VAGFDGHDVRAGLDVEIDADQRAPAPAADGKGLDIVTEGSDSDAVDVRGSVNRQDGELTGLKAACRDVDLYGRQAGICRRGGVKRERDRENDGPRESESACAHVAASRSWLALSGRH
jgi:hypothetical protein